MSDRTDSAEQITRILGQLKEGDESAKEQLVQAAYSELRDMAQGLMHGERRDHTLQPTALVNEAVIRVFGKNDAANIPNRAFFFGAMSRAMRHVLVDHARRRQAARRGGSAARVPLDETMAYVEASLDTDILALDEALSRLQADDQRVFQVVMLRYFGGRSHDEISECLEISPSTVDRDWRFGRAWLKRQLT